MQSAEILSVVGDRTVSSVLREGAALHPDRPLLVFDDLAGNVATYSWRDVLLRSEAIAEHLQSLGMARGDAIHVHLGNRPEFIFVWFAAAHIAAKIVPTNVAGAVPELAYIVEHSKARLSITEEASRDRVAEARQAAGRAGPVLLCDRDLPTTRGPGSPPTHDPAPTDDLGVIYTSGTTARPKGVRVTQANYLYAGETVAAALRLTSADRFLTVLPLFHANAQYYSAMGTLVAGGALVLASRFTASGYADLAIRHGATVGSLFAAPIRMILAHEAAEHWTRHRLRVVAFAQDLTDGEVEQWDATIGAPLLQLYGMTETIGPPIMNSLSWPRRHNAIGRPVLGYLCQVRREDGTPARTGEPGELLVGGVPGVSLMAGYLDDAEATDAVMRAGWFSTGDLVQRDADGLISFVGRTRDMIKRAGENVAAGEVEAVLLSHPSVADAAVVGVPDPIRDEQIVAFVVLHAGHAVGDHELRTWCSERLASFRVPSFVSVEEGLPRTAVGKIQKHRLRAGWDSRGDSADIAGGLTRPLR